MASKETAAARARPEKEAGAPGTRCCEKKKKKKKKRYRNAGMARIFNTPWSNTRARPLRKADLETRGSLT